MALEHTNKFAKVFDTPSGQFLVYWEYDGDEMKLNQMVHIENVVVANMAVSFDDHENGIKVFNAYDQEKANSMCKHITESVNGMVN